MLAGERRRRMWPGLACGALLLAAAWPAPGRATIAPPAVAYRVEGFTADSKHAVFRREWSSNTRTCRELSLVVYAVATARPVSTVVLLRQGRDCPAASVTKTAGLAERARLMARIGAVVPRTRLELQGAALVGPELRLTLDVQGNTPSLDGKDEASALRLRAPLRLRLIAARRGAPQTLLDRKTSLAPIPSPSGTGLYLWRKPALSDGQLAADGRTLALVLDDAPALFTLPALPAR